jgi:hypothetical protein
VLRFLSSLRIHRPRPVMNPRTLNPMALPFGCMHAQIHLFVRSFIHSQALIVQDGPLASLLGFIDHTHTHGKTPLDECSARHRDLYLHRTTQHTNTTNIHAPSGIRTRDRSNQATADLRLTPRGHCDRRMHAHTYLKLNSKMIPSSPLYKGSVGLKHKISTFSWCI